MEQKESDLLSDGELDQLAEVTADDIDNARDWWQSHAPADGRDLLDAEPDEPESA